MPQLLEIAQQFGFLPALRRWTWGDQLTPQSNDNPHLISFTSLNQQRAIPAKGSLPQPGFPLDFSPLNLHQQWTAPDFISVHSELNQTGSRLKRWRLPYYPQHHPRCFRSGGTGRVGHREGEKSHFHEHYKCRQKEETSTCRSDHLKPRVLVYHGNPHPRDQQQHKRSFSAFPHTMQGLKPKENRKTSS